VIACIRCSSRGAGVRISPGDSVHPRASFRIGWLMPMGALRTRGETAASALYLAADEAIFATGQCQVTDGDESSDDAETPDVWSGAGRNEV
jgi:hypothetical protein